MKIESLRLPLIVTIIQHNGDVYVELEMTAGQARRLGLAKYIGPDSKKRVTLEKLFARVKKTSMDFSKWSNELLLDIYQDGTPKLEVRAKSNSARPGGYYTNVSIRSIKV